MGGGVAVALQHVGAHLRLLFRRNEELLRHRPHALPAWLDYAGHLPPPCIEPQWQGQLAGPDPLAPQHPQHQAPAWQQAVAPQQHNPPAMPAAWFPVVQHVPNPVVPVVPNLHHIVGPPPLAAPVQHNVAPAQHVAPVPPPAVIRPQVPLPPPAHALQVPVNAPVADEDSDDPVAKAAAGRLQRLAASRAK